MAAPGAVPGHGNLGGDIRKVFGRTSWYLLNITVCISLANDDSGRLCKNYAHMLFLCTSLIIGGFRYRKNGGIVDLSLSVPWHRLWITNTIVTVFITFHCHSSRKFRIHLASIVIYFAFLHPHIQWPISAYDFWIFQSDKHMWITCPFPVDCPLLDQNRFTNVPVMRDKKIPEIYGFYPPYTPFYEFLIFFLEM